MKVKNTVLTPQTIIHDVIRLRDVGCEAMSVLMSLDPLAFAKSI